MVLDITHIRVIDSLIDTSALAGFKGFIAPVSARECNKVQGCYGFQFQTNGRLEVRHHPYKNHWLLNWYISLPLSGFKDFEQLRLLGDATKMTPIHLETEVRDHPYKSHDSLDNWYIRPPPPASRISGICFRNLYQASVSETEGCNKAHRFLIPTHL